MNQDTQISPHISEKGEFIYTQLNQLIDISNFLLNSGMTKFGNPAQIGIVIMKGKQLGISMFEALDQIAVINNRAALSGSLASALVSRSGLLVDKTYSFDGEGDTRKCTVTIQRKGQSKTTRSFSIKEARKADLYPGKPGSAWSKFPDNMLYWRALGFCYRMDFSDVLMGMYLTEELSDTVQEINITPIDSPTPIKAEPPKAPKPIENAPDPDPVDTAKAMASPIIADPSNVVAATPIAKNDNPVAKSENLGIGLQSLMELATKDGINHEELLEVVNGLRLFPRGIEHKLEFLPQAKVATLIKNWEVVVRQIERTRKDKETK